MREAGAGPRVLVVGAGAVGQVFAYHLAEAGARVTFFVREKYAPALREGLTLFALRSGEDERRRFDSYDVVTSLEEVRARAFDQAWLTVSSTGLRGPWLEELLDATPGALVVAPLPTQVDRDYLLELLPPERLVQCVVTFMSYLSPLPSETRDEPGMAYWFPPLVKCGFAGTDPAAARGVVALLRAGGCPARHQPDLVAEASFAVAILMPQLAALEGVGFDFEAYRADKARVAMATRGCEETLLVVASRLGRAVPFALRLVNRSFSYRLAATWGPRLAPFDLEAYWRFHFTKVGDQTRLMLKGYAEDARDAGLAHEALDHWVDDLARRDAGAE